MLFIYMYIDRETPLCTQWFCSKLLWSGLVKNPCPEPLSPMLKILEPSCNQILNLGNINIIMTQYYSILNVNYCVSIPKYSTTYNITPTPVALTCISLPFLFLEVAKVKIPQKFHSSFFQMLKSNDSVENKCSAKEVLSSH